MHIIKSTGDKVEFNPKKIRDSLKRTGAKADLIEHVIANVTKQVKEGMTTHKLFAIVRKEVRKESKCIAHRYNLRASLLKLGPAGFKFEKYVSSILNAYNYDAHVPEDEYAGLCVDHEIDVVAKKEGRTAVIEAKFRNKFGDSVNLKDTMATWARYLDLRDGSKSGKATPYFDELWIVTNGRFSDRALQFGLCKGVHMIGWSTEEKSLARLVDHAALYPITVIDGLKQWELDRFAQRDLMLCLEIADEDARKLASRVGIPLQRMKNIMGKCKEVVTAQK